MGVIAVGNTGVYRNTVTDAVSAHTLGNPGVHVLASPILGLWCELACHNAICNDFAPGQTSVGIHLDFYHMAATAVGDEVTVTATITGIDRRRIVFAFEGFDSHRQVVRGIHERLLVEMEAFLASLPKPPER